MREYIDSPIRGLFERVFNKDRWGLTDILKASDRRIGKEKLKLMKEKTDSGAVKSIIELGEKPIQSQLKKVICVSMEIFCFTSHLY
jgi:hypothetical protein